MKKKYIVKVVDKTERVYHIEAYNPTQAREEYESLVEEPGSVVDSPVDRSVRVKLDAPPKEKKTEVIGEEGESTPEPTKKGKRK